MARTIWVSEEVWEDLHKARIRLGVKTLQQVIEKMFRLVTKFKLAGELKELK